MSHLVYKQTQRIQTLRTLRTSQQNVPFQIYSVCEPQFMALWRFLKTLSCQTFHPCRHRKAMQTSCMEDLYLSTTRLAGSQSDRIFLHHRCQQRAAHHLLPCLRCYCKDPNEWKLIYHSKSRCFLMQGTSRNPQRCLLRCNQANVTKIGSPTHL